MPGNMNLNFKIRALVEGVKDVTGLNQSLNRVKNQARDQIPDNTRQLREGMNRTGSLAKDLADELKGLFALGTITVGVKAAINATREAEKAFKGLEAVANSTGVGIERAWNIVGEATADNLMSTAEASKALQNLLARGFSADQAVAALNRLKDAAAFNRAAHLSLGEAVLTATEGIKLESSELLDNAGIAKNISVIYQEFADQVGKTANQLTEAEKVTAIYNGILRETEAQQGNAAKAAGGLEGDLASLKKSQNELAVAFGSALVPAIIQVTRFGTAMIDDWIKPFLGGIEIMSIKLAAFVKSGKDLFSGNFAAIQANWALADEMAMEVVKRYEKGLIPAAQALKDNVDQEAIARKKAAAAAAEQAKKDREAAEEQQKLSDKIQGTVDRLRLQADTLSMNQVEAEIYKLKLAGASEAQLEAARTALQSIEAYERFTESQKEAAEALKKSREDAARALAQEKREAEAAAAAIAQAEQSRMAAAGDTVEQILNTLDPMRALKKEQEQLEALHFKYQILSAEEYQAALIDLQTRMQEVGAASDQMTQFSIQAARNIQTAFADFLFRPFDQGMKGMLAGFVQTIHRMISELLAAEMLKSFFTAMSGGAKAGSGSFGPVMATLAASVQHQGGPAGSGPKRMIPASAFLAAPRLHNGTLGLKPNEVPAILEQGETVIPKGQTNSQGVRIVNVVDPSLAQDYLESSAGERVIMNILERNAGAVREVLA